MQNELVTSFSTACRVLFEPGATPETRSEADVWIAEFQKTTDAWLVADALLGSEDNGASLNLPNGIDAKLVFLSAKTFQVKVRYDFLEQIPSEDHVNLREKLIGHLQRHFRKGNRAVLTQLCLAVAALLIQMEEWDDPIKDLASRFSNEPDASLCLVELLQIIPEEHRYGGFPLSESRRAKICAEMFDCCSDVLRFLQRSVGMSNGKPDVLEKIFRCLKSWVSIVEIPGDELSASPFLDLLFEQLLTNSDLIDTAASTLSIILSKYNIQDEPAHMQMMGTIVPKVFQLQTLYVNAINEEKTELASCVGWVFVAMADAYLPLILGPQEIDELGVLRLVMLHSKHPSREGLLWDFWIRLLQSLYALSRDNKELYDLKCQKLAPVVKDLVYIVLEQFRLPADHDDSLKISSDSGMDDEVYESRRDLADLLANACFLVGDSGILGMINEKLQPLAANLISKSAQDRQNAWQPVEGLLFAFSSIGRECRFASSSSASHVVVDCVIEICLRLPNISVLLRETVTKTFGSYSKFLKFNPQKLEPIVHYVLDTLTLVPVIGSSATKTLLYLTADCGRDMMFAANRLFEVSQSDTSGVDKFDRLDILECLALIISEQPCEQALEAFNHVLQPACTYILNMATCLNNNSYKEEDGDLERLIYSVRMYEILLKFGWRVDRRSENDSPRHPGFQIFEKAFPGLVVVSKGFCHQSRLVERVGVLFKQAMRKFGSHFRGNLDALLQLCVECFLQSPMSPFVYVAGIAIEVYSREEENHGKFMQVLRAMAQKVFEVLPTLEAFTANPDIVEDFFITNDRAVSFITNVYMADPITAVIIKYAANGALIEHRQANGAVLLFIENFLLKGMKHEAYAPFTKQCFEENGQLLVSNIVFGIAGGVPRRLISQPGEGSLGMTLYTVAKVTHRWEVDDQSRGPLYTFRHLLFTALSEPRCAYIGSDLSNWFIQELPKACVKTGRFEDFEVVLFDFSDKARLRLRRK